MSGYNAVLKIRRLEEEVNALGFRMAHSQSNRYSEFGDVVALYPKDEDLPIYSRDTEVFVGSLENLEIWLRGAQWARRYDTMLLGKSADSRRERKEQDLRNQKLVKMLVNDNESN